MADRNRRRQEEKERLWNEVLGKKRAYESTDAGTQIELTIGEHEKELQDTLKSADSAMEELNRILLSQQKELREMSRQNGISDADLDKMEAEIRKDYGIEKKEEKPAASGFDSKQVFDDIYNLITARVMGQKDALKQLITAFRRPYVMGEEAGKPKNVILVTGPEGSGRHEAVAQMARSLYEKGVFISDEVYTIDMSRYGTGAQEQIFLQDLYEALQGKGSVICFENFENGFPAFLRMIGSLATTGKTVLNKRYVLSKGILVENQTGLVKDSVDTLHVGDKYLIFITSGKASKVQDAFGADFMYHVLDVVTLKPLDEESVKAIIDKQMETLGSKCKEQLKVQVTADDEVKEWIKAHYDKTRGADAISSIYHDFYVSISQLVLEQNLGSMETIQLKVEDDVPTAVLDEVKITLSRSKNSQEEIDAVNAEMNEIVGLKEVKEYVHSLESHVKMQKIRREQGLKTAEVSKHMIFTGNPGTGKTTIARLLSRYMKAIGALTQGQLVEVTRADLVAQYVGQTAPLTMNVIKSAIGGVLFIDEAYSLYRSRDDAFGLECIDTLVKAMEDNRDNLIVILAGYKKEMSVFLEANSGLKSRFPNLIYFPDYTGEELVQIAQIQAKSKGYKIDEQALVNLELYFNTVQANNAAEAGNGRLARNVIEDAILKQSRRVSSEPDADLELLKDEDFDYSNDYSKKPGE
ncbi:MAG: AAA family ATPase [Solobacterium sp.]|nr:AAA family ATPase [Solobacterium sp.]